MIATSEVTVSVTLDSSRNLEAAVEDLRKFAEVPIEKEKCIICVVGDGIRNTPGIAGDVFQALKDGQVNVWMISQGASKINVAFVVEGRRLRQGRPGPPPQVFRGLGRPLIEEPMKNMGGFGSRGPPRSRAWTSPRTRGRAACRKRSTGPIRPSTSSASPPISGSTIANVRKEFFLYFYQDWRRSARRS